MWYDFTYPYYLIYLTIHKDTVRSALYVNSHVEINKFPIMISDRRLMPIMKLGFKMSKLKLSGRLISLIVMKTLEVDLCYEVNGRDDLLEKVPI